MIKSYKGRFAAHIFIQIILVMLLSLTAMVPIPDFKDTNWDIVLFLTPLGILKNMIADSPVMRSFYLDQAKAQVDLSGPQVLLMAAIFLAMIFNAWLAFRRLGKIS